jgi:arylsulfatase A-like enzyme
MSNHPDDLFDHVVVPDSRMALRIAGQGAAAGLLAGALEGVGIALRGRLPGHASALAQAMVATMALDVVVGAGCGLVGGLVAQLVLRRAVRWRRYQVGFTLTIACLLAFFLAPLAWRLGGVDGRVAEALGTLALLGLVSVTAWFNAGYWIRRELVGAGFRAGWTVVCGAIAALIAALGVALGGTRAPEAVVVLARRPDLLLVTIDTLRRDHVGLYAPPGAASLTPTLDRLGRAGLVIEDAATAVPETVPSHASMLTGLQPVAHGVFANGTPLRAGLLTVPEQLAVAGYRNAAFVGSYALDAASGLSQGFEVYDDAFAPFAAGAVRARLARALVPAWFRWGRPERTPWLLERDGPVTVARALRWVEGLGAEPFFLWVHLFEPHAPYEPHDGAASPLDDRARLADPAAHPLDATRRDALRTLYAGEVRAADRALGELVDGLRARGRLRGGLVVVAGDHGESLGEHGIDFQHHGLYEEVLRVPMVVWTDAPTWTPGMRLPGLVSVDCVANTLLGFVGLTMSGTTSRPLVSVAEGLELPEVSLLLAGREGPSRQDGTLVGVRATSGVKYIRRADGREELYDLRADPGETDDLVARQPGALATARDMVTHLAGPLRAAAAPAGASAGPMLEALGYRE